MTIVLQTTVSVRARLVPLPPTAGKNFTVTRGHCLQMGRVTPRLMSDACKSVFSLLCQRPDRARDVFSTNRPPAAQLVRFFAASNDSLSNDAGKRVFFHVAGPR